MRRKLKKFFACVCAFTLLATSFSFAAEDQTIENAVSASLPQATSKTVTDSHGNKYTVSGLSSIVGKKAETHTEFKVSYYFGGKKAPVDAYTKKLTGVGRVWFYGSASDNQFSKSANKTGASGSLIATDTYDFLVKSLNSTHKFSCEGGSVSFYTEM